MSANRTEGLQIPQGQIDLSSTTTFRKSLQEAATKARHDAQTKEDEAAELRRQAQSWIDRELPDAAEPLLREAAALEETAAQRRQAAAAYEAV